jgi:putative selenate reductase FAD-binding subunit
MIIEYYRPRTLEEAMQLLARTEPLTLPLGGGSSLNRPSPDPFAVVDLQSLGLNMVQRRGNFIDLGATVTLETLLEEDLSPALIRSIQHEATYNLRQVGTVAGTLVAAGGRSPFATVLLALDAQLTLLPGDEQVSLGDLLPVRVERLGGRLITQVTLPLNTSLAYEYVARTPADLPIVCAAAAQWRSGRTRLALGGFGKAPLLAMDGPEPGGIEAAARDAYSQAGDEWASAEYRQEMAPVLARRCLQGLAGA